MTQNTTIYYTQCNIHNNDAHKTAYTITIYTLQAITKAMFENNVIANDKYLLKYIIIRGYHFAQNIAARHKK